MNAYKCPRCTASLKTIDYDGVEIETCPVCEGEWLDAGELREIVQNVERRFDPEDVKHLNSLRKRIVQVKELAHERLLCPKCHGQKLRPFNYACGSGIILDKCPNCGGIWLDRGELEMVQALVDEWKGHVSRDRRLSEDTKRKILEKTETESGTGVLRSRVTYVLAVLRSFI